MHEDFETRVLPVVSRFARLRLRDEERIQDAIGLCWFRYQQTAKRLEIPAKAFAWYAILQTLSGRNMPGKKARGEDALDKAWRCAAMQEARDPGPGPDKIAQEREEWEVLRARLTPRQAGLVQIGHLDISNQEMAELLGVSPGRVSQMRREIERLRRE